MLDSVLFRLFLIILNPVFMNVLSMYYLTLVKPQSSSRGMMQRLSNILRTPALCSVMGKPPGGTCPQHKCPEAERLWLYSVFFLALCKLLKIHQGKSSPGSMMINEFMMLS
jgi:hypothetical protein